MVLKRLPDFLILFLPGWWCGCPAVDSQKYYQSNLLLLRKQNEKINNWVDQKQHMKLNGLDLFSGIGGCSLALREYVRTIAYCECNKFDQAILLSRMHDGQLDRAPIWDDVNTMDGGVLEQLPEPVDIILAGFPCQQISCSGTGKGLEGKQSGLFFEILRIAKYTRARWIFLENSPGIRNAGRLERVLQELAALGFDARWMCLSASSVGAHHHRDRWFLLAKRGEPGAAQKEKAPVADAVCEGGQHQRRNAVSPTLRSAHVAGGSTTGQTSQDSPGLQGSRDDSRQNPWGPEPGVPRVAYGIPDKMDRVSGLGNAVVPAQARKAFQILSGIGSPSKKII